VAGDQGYSGALNNSSAPLRLSQFFLHAAAETFRAVGGLFEQGGKSGRLKAA
jgi:hypothetical protein